MTFLGDAEGPKSAQTISDVVAESVEHLVIQIPGTAVPQGSKTGRILNGKVHFYEANPKHKAWRQTVKDAAIAALGGRDGFGKDEAICLTVTFFMPRPKSATRTRPTVAPDLDKLVRSIGDSLTDAHVWGDDGQVVEIHARQFYADDLPHVTVTVSAL